jgi:nickel superoxide dismutase
MKSRVFPILAVAVLAMAVFASPARSHCEIPCGIYDDAMRYDMLSEHIKTIEKSMDMITKLSAEGEKNYNQLVRWVVNKEDHAGKFMDIIWQYFLNQRIKPADADTGAMYDDYITQLKLMHQMLIYAMECKQTTDKANTEKLRGLVAESRALYFKEHGYEH